MNIFFRNAQVLRLDVSNLETPLTEAGIANALAVRQLQDCPEAMELVPGFVAPVGDVLTAQQGLQAADLVMPAQGLPQVYLLALGVAAKVLPKAVIEQTTRDRVRKIEQEEVRKVGRKEMRELRAQVREAMLPTALVRRSRVLLLLDVRERLLLVDSSSEKKAEWAIERLALALPGLRGRRLRTAVLPFSVMTQWAAGGELPEHLQMDSDLVLESPEEARISFHNGSPDASYVRDQVAAGKQAVRLALTYSDRLSFVLHDPLQFKRLRFLDALLESGQAADTEEDRMQADLVLMAGVLRELMALMLPVLGGELSD